MKAGVELRHLIGLGILLAGTAAAPAGGGLEDPLSIERALDNATGHPRTRLNGADSGRYPRPQPLYLDCHRLAYSSTSGFDNARNLASQSLIDPVARQRLAILERFFDVLLADQTLTRYNEAMAVAYVQFDRARARQELGQYSELRVTELEVAFEDIRRRSVASEASQRLTRSLLAQALDHPRNLPRDLAPPRLQTPPEELPQLDEMVEAASAGNRWLIDLKAGVGEPGRRLLDMELRQQVLELLLRLESLSAVRRHAEAETLRRDLKLEESRTLYEQEVKADLGYSMSRQTEARLREHQVAYCRALAWAELDALRGETVWAGAQEEDSP